MKTNFLIFILLVFLPFPSFALSFCPRCNYRVGSDCYKCPKCLLILDSAWSQVKPVKSTITARKGYDTFIRHPHANNRAYKADRNAGGDKTGEIGIWGGPTTLRYLIKFDIETAMNYYGVDYMNFTPKKALLYISTLSKKSKIEMPVAIYPLTKSFTPGFDEFRTRERKTTGCTWYNATSTMPWLTEGGEYERNCVSKGILKSGERNVIDVTEVVKYFYSISKKKGDWFFNGFIIMSDPDNPLAPQGFVTIYSLDADNISFRPELFIQ